MQNPGEGDDVRAMPDGPARSVAAANLVVALIRSPETAADPARLRVIGEMVRIAGRFPPAEPEWRRVRAVASIMVLMGVAAEGRTVPPKAIEQVDEFEREAGDDPAVRQLADSARTMFGFLLADAAGDSSATSRAVHEVDRLASAAAARGSGGELAALTAAIKDLHEQARTGGDITASVAVIRATAARVFPPGSPALAELENSVETLAALRSPEAGATMAASYAKLAEAARTPGLADADRALRHAAAGGAALDGGNERNLDRIAAGIEHFRAALALSAPADPRHAFLLASLGLGLYRRIELTGDGRDLDEAIDVLVRARGAAGGPSAPEWSLINEMLAALKARRGDAAPHRVALDALRNTMWRVLLEEDPAQARRVAGGAASTAVEIARTSLLAGEPADAISALEGGRGLMLYAAAEFRDVAARLEAAKEPDLAARWRRVVESGKPDDAPTHLRTDVLTVLTAQSDLLDPPKLAEIRHALRVLDADALVYLVPSGDGHPGYAVAAPAEGSPGYVGLANLSDDEDRDIEAWLRVLNARDFDAEAFAGVPVNVAEALDLLCDWAWRAAMKPIIEKYLPLLPKPASGRDPRVILVPMGRLALVPWQAARRGDGVFAVELAAISFAASARMLCRAAAVAPVPTAPLGLVVGDPDTRGTQTSLPAARLEAYAVHQAFYRGGRYLGTYPNGLHSSSGDGTAREVLDWLRAARPGDASVVHLACHGGVEGSSAFLVLAGGDRITAEQIVHELTQGPDRGIGVAVLAACRTNHSINGYDEAYSVGTAFLAGGVRSVLSTQWAVRDDSTSALMYMFHHYRTVGRLPAWAALREAQLWMLRPDRSVPPGTPEPLRRRLAGIGAVGLDAWAGFVHQGQ